MRFKYRALTKTGKVTEGSVEANSEDSALEILQSRNLIVTYLEKETVIDEEKLKNKKLKAQDLVFFFRQLSILVKSGVSLVEALTAVNDQVEDKDFRDILSLIIFDVDGGMLLSKAFSKFKNIFSIYIIKVIETGEITGRLAAILEHLADHVERNYILTSKIKGAFYYPIAVLVLCFIVILIMLIFVMPKIEGVFDEFDAQLPLPTRIILGISNFLMKYGIIVLLILVGVVVGLWRYIKTPQGKEKKDRIELKIPVIGELLTTINLARIAENLGTLIQGGVPIAQSISTTAEVITNSEFHHALVESAKGVRRGETLSSNLSRFKIISPVFIQIVSAGEKSGNLGDILLDISRFYSNQVDLAVGSLMSLLEPTLIVIIGVVVGFIAAAVLLPMYNLAGSM